MNVLNLKLKFKYFKPETKKNQKLEIKKLNLKK